MLTKKSISAPILAIFMSLSSGNLLAAEDTISSILPPVWPFIAIVLFIFVFRKQLNCVPPFKPEDEATSPVKQALPEPEAPSSVKEEPPEAPTPTITPDTDTETATEASDSIIDLKDDSQQCQASTTKGTRCKRKTTLEDTSISIGDKTYLLTVCRQHNNKKLKPFSELIK